MGSLLVTYLAIVGPSADLIVDTRRLNRMSPGPRDWVFAQPLASWLAGPLTALRPLIGPVRQPILLGDAV